MHRDAHFDYVLHYDCSYDDQLLVEYRVKCNEGDAAFVNVTYMDIEGPETCHDPMGNPK